MRNNWVAQCSIEIVGKMAIISLSHDLWLLSKESENVNALDRFHYPMTNVKKSARFNHRAHQRHPRATCDFSFTFNCLSRSAFVKDKSRERAKDSQIVSFPNGFFDVSISKSFYFFPSIYSAKYVMWAFSVCFLQSIIWFLWIGSDYFQRLLTLCLPVKLFSMLSSCVCDANSSSINSSKFPKFSGFGILFQRTLHETEMWEKKNALRW